MTQANDFVGGIYLGKDTEVGFDAEYEDGERYISKINYILINGKDIDPMEWEQESIQILLEGFLYLNDATDLSKKYFDKLLVN